MTPPWLIEARKDIGRRERLGPNDSLWLRAMWATLDATWLRGQPWCGGAAALWMRRAGFGYPRLFFRAASWATWGRQCPPAVGAIIVTSRKGGNHVGILTGKTPTGRIVLLGGNQGDAVRESSFDPALVRACRWPDGFPMPRPGIVPTIVVTASRSEA